MIYSGFSLEILVNNKPLKECSEYTNKRNITTGSSYVLDNKTGRTIKSDKTFYAAVEELGTNYVVQYSASSNHFSPSCTTLKAKLFVDGQWDHTCKEIQKSAVKARKDGFFDEKRQKHLFKFDVTNWIDDGKEDLDIQRARSKFGGMGAISVYFYKAEDSEKDEKLNNHNKNGIQKVKVPESFGIGKGMKFSTGFEKSQCIKMASKKMLRSILATPMAVLHIHYRPASWLRKRNIYDIPIKIEKSIEGESKDIENGEEKIKMESNEFEYIQLETKIEKEPIIVKKEFSKIEDIPVKREFVEIEKSKQESRKKIKIEDQKIKTEESNVIKRIVRKII